MPVKINCETENGGAVTLNKKDGVWASYSVVRVADRPAIPLLYCNIKLKSGKQAQFFVNRDTGLIVVDIIDKDGKGGTEIVRTKVE